MEVEETRRAAWAWVVARQLMLLYETSLEVAYSALGCEGESEKDKMNALVEALLAGARTALDRLGRGGDTTKRILGGGVVKTAFRTPKGESAKEFARKMMKKNPNAFFYRHNLPGEETKQGDWSPAEIDRFVEVAKTHGCGDKWGLFASHIPGRVGYQCSAAYRQKIIPAGLLMDDNFVLSVSGCAAWVGRPGARAGTGKDYD